jgi:preprotein translocase subunit SecA
MELELHTAIGTKKSKELKLLQYATEEVNKLRSEVDILADQKLQVFFA